MLTQDSNTLTIKGRDLVYAIPESLIRTDDSSTITVIPANPAYWTGTRIAAIAAGYQNYRPLKFKVTYVPQCAVTQQGNVLAGTLWNTLPSMENLQQTLRTSPGGMLTQCYKTHTSDIKMKSNLQFNLFRIGGKFDQESNPFIYVAIARACTDANNHNIIPGYFYVDYTYTFKNPIGLTYAFYNSGLTNLDTKTLHYQNDAFVACYNDPQNGITPGMLIQIDYDSTDQPIYTYNDDIKQPPGDKPVWFFSNSTIGGQPSMKEKPRADIDFTILYNDVAARQAQPFTMTSNYMYVGLPSPPLIQDEYNYVWIFNTKTIDSQIAPLEIDNTLKRVVTVNPIFNWSYHDEDVMPTIQEYIDTVNYTAIKITPNPQLNDGYIVVELDLGKDVADEDRKNVQKRPRKEIILNKEEKKIK
jgi:hypothetical protein